MFAPGRSSRLFESSCFKVGVVEDICHLKVQVNVVILNPPRFSNVGIKQVGDETLFLMVKVVTTGVVGLKANQGFGCTFTGAKSM